MRTERDVRENPVAGDVVIYGPQWQQARVDVTNILEDGRVQGLMDGRIHVTYTIQQWRKWMADADVLHIAQPGGEA